MAEPIRIKAIFLRPVVEAKGVGHPRLDARGDRVQWEVPAAEASYQVLSLGHGGRIVAEELRLEGVAPALAGLADEIVQRPGRFHDLLDVFRADNAGRIYVAIGKEPDVVGNPCPRMVLVPGPFRVDLLRSGQKRMTLLPEVR